MFDEKEIVNLGSEVMSDIYDEAIIKFLNQDKTKKQLKEKLKAAFGGKETYDISDVPKVVHISAELLENGGVRYSEKKIKMVLQILSDKILSAHNYDVKDKKNKEGLEILKTSISLVFVSTNILQKPVRGLTRLLFKFLRK